MEFLEQIKGIMNYSQFVVPIILMTGLIVIDYITGLIKGLLRGQLNSYTPRVGLWRKVAYYIEVFTAIILESFCVVVGIAIPVPLTYGVIIAVAFVEVISILENLGEINPKLTDNRFMSLFSFVKENDAKQDEFEETDETEGAKHARN